MRSYRASPDDASSLDLQKHKHIMVGVLIALVGALVMYFSLMAAYKNKAKPNFLKDPKDDMKFSKGKLIAFSLGVPVLVGLVVAMSMSYYQ
jgi:hypothetical protein